MMNSNADLTAFLAAHPKLAVVSGAGVSTASGIPDYRDREGEWKHARPMLFAEFAGSGEAQQRYWARSYVGWQRFARAKPNASHHALARLESLGRLDTLITQNVDRLHQQAGSQQVIDLHGSLSEVRCLECGSAFERAAFQAQMRRENLDWHAQVHRYKPDGDAELAANSYADFVVPKCANCNGIIKPDVVMFGEAVPKLRVEQAVQAVERADALLVVGSSLMVFSGFRFARHAHAQGKSIAIVNQGKTRADDLADLKIEAECARALSGALRSLDQADGVQGLGA